MFFRADCSVCGHGACGWYGDAVFQRGSGKTPSGADRWLMVVAPVVLAIALAAMVGVESLKPKEELRLQVSDQGPLVGGMAGAQVAARVLYYRDLDGPEGGELVSKEVSLRLMAVPADREPTPVAAQWLRSSKVVGMEGNVRLPTRVELASRGLLLAPMRWVAETRSNRLRRAEVPFRWEDGTSRELAVQPRTLPRLQQQKVYPFRPGTSASGVEFGAGPDGISFESLKVHVFVEGGVCIPEVPCRVWVLPSKAVWSSPHPLEVRASKGTTVESPVSWSSPAVVTVHGSVGEVELVWGLAGLGTEMAVSTVRLPLMAGGVGLALEGGAVPTAVRLEFSHGARAVVVDMFHNGLWRGTTSYSEAEVLAPVSLPVVLGPSDPSDIGRWRVQVRTSGYDVNTAVSRVFWVGEEPDTPKNRRLLKSWGIGVTHLDQSLRERTTRRSGPQVRGALGALKPATVDAEHLKHLIWAHGFERVSIRLPDPVSTYPQDLARTRATQQRVRGLALTAIGLVALWVLVSVLRRGLRAAREAGALMVAAGDAGAASGKHRIERALRVVSAVLALAMVFVAVWLLVLYQTPV